MSVAFAVAVLAPDAGTCVDDGNILLNVVYVANVAAAIIGYRPAGLTDIPAIIKQQ